MHQPRCSLSERIALVHQPRCFLSERIALEDQLRCFLSEYIALAHQLATFTLEVGNLFPERCTLLPQRQDVLPRLLVFDRHEIGSPA